jgi:hypothetical protein
MADMTPAELAFFATGELTEELLAQSTPTPEPEPTPAPAPAAPEPAPAPDAATLLQQTLEEERQARRALEEKFNALHAQLSAKPEPAPEPAPDPENDPLGAMMHQLKTLNAQVEHLSSSRVQESTQQQQAQQFEQFVQQARQVKEAFEKTTPDFNDAYAHIRAVRKEDLRAVGVPAADIPKLLLQDEITLTQSAFQSGKNPAQEMYNMAKRYGYTAKAAQPKAESKIEQLQKGMEAAKQPARGGSDGDPTIATLKDASSADLTKLVLDDDMWNRVVGGKAKDIF